MIQTRLLFTGTCEPRASTSKATDSAVSGRLDGCVLKKISWLANRLHLPRILVGFVCTTMLYVSLRFLE